MSCITSNVDLWMERNCTEYASTQGQSFYNELFDNFYKSSNGLWIPGVSPSNPYLDETLRFQNLLVDLCNSGTNGQYCREPLNKICSEYSRSDTANPIIKRICGCHLPEYEYSSNRACDPICSSYDIIKYIPPGMIVPDSCTSTVCIIDNFTLIANGSSVGNITFNQACPYCSGITSCNCIIGDINIIAQDSRMGGLNLEQNCGGSLECYSNIDGVKVPVENCSEYIQSLGLSTSTVEEEKKIYKTYSIGFIIFIIILIFFFFTLLFLYILK